MKAVQRWKAYPQQVGIAFDQFINALIPPLYTLSYADETMSARLYRGARRGRLAGRLLIGFVDFLFAWQGEDESVNAAAGKRVTGHCERAYWKEKLRRGLPPEYRQ